VIFSSDPVEFGYQYAVDQHLGNLWVFEADFKWNGHCPWMTYLPNLVFAELLVRIACGGTFLRQ
jgi:hypothetical protein